MSKFEKFQFDNFILDEYNQPYVEGWENNSSINTTEEEKTEEQAPEPAQEAVVVQPEEVKVPEPPAPLFSEEEVITFSEEEMQEKEKEAHGRGYEEGYAAGQEKAKAEAENMHDALLSEINNRLMILLSDNKQQEDALDNRIIEISQSVIQKLVPILEAKMAQNLVKDFLEKNFASFKDEDRLAFYFHPEVLPFVQEEIAKLANKNDFEGKISLHKDENMQTSDCRVEWESGGVERNGKQMLDKINKILEANKHK